MAAKQLSRFALCFAFVLAAVVPSHSTKIEIHRGRSTAAISVEAASLDTAAGRVGVAPTCNTASYVKAGGVLSKSDCQSLEAHFNTLKADLFQRSQCKSVFNKNVALGTKCGEYFDLFVTAASLAVKGLNDVCSKPACTELEGFLKKSPLKPFSLAAGLVYFINCKAAKNCDADRLAPAAPAAPCAAPDLVKPSNMKFNAHGKKVMNQLEMIQAPYAWANGATGLGIRVGIIDTGIKADHPLFDGRFRTSNWIDHIKSAAQEASVDPLDDHGHGSGAAAAVAGWDQNVITGAAPEATIVVCRASRKAPGEHGYEARERDAELACFDDLISGKNKVDIINYSHTIRTRSDEDKHYARQFIARMTEATKNGILIVVPTGNQGDGKCGVLRNLPSAFEDALNVGGVQADRTPWDSSIGGPIVYDWDTNTLRDKVLEKPDVAAQAKEVCVAAHNANTIIPSSGTSFAAPLVAGAVAALWSKYPTLKNEPARTIQLLRQTATPLRNRCEFEFVGDEPAKPDEPEEDASEKAKAKYAKKLEEYNKEHKQYEQEVRDWPEAVKPYRDTSKFNGRVGKGIVNLKEAILHWDRVAPKKKSQRLVQLV